MAKWYSEGIKINPAANTLLADTGTVDTDLTGEIRLLVASTAVGAVVLQHMDTANLVVLHSQIFPLIANGVLELNPIVDLLQGERIRIIANALITGQVQCSMMSNVIV
jgi:hypothetical protein